MKEIILENGEIVQISELFSRRCWPKYLEKYKKFLTYLDQVGFEYVGHGTTRFAFKRGNYFIKVPFTHRGDYSNYIEAKCWHRDRWREEIKVAPCRQLSNGALLMVKVEMVDNIYFKCSWADSVDCGQVGLYKGNFVAYDL
jgi:hypothetical protein